MSTDALAHPQHDPVLATIHAELVDAGVEESAITSDARLEDLELDSLDVAQLLAAIKTRHQVVLEQPDVAGVTVGRLVELVVGATGD